MHLDRGFWTITGVIVLLAIASVLYWAYAPITSIMPEAVDRAQQIDLLFRFLAGTGFALGFAVIGYLLYFSIRYRRRADQGDDAIGLQIHDNHRLELWWTIIPSIFIVVLGFVSVKLFLEIEPVNAQGNTLVVEGLGHQWYYTFRYPGIHGEVREMHLPLSQPVTLHVSSYDVIHSFWIPDMRLKADMVPGVVNTLVFTPTRAGRYNLICTEFCGTFHGEMRSGTKNDPAFVYIDPPDKYKAWYDAQQRANAHESDAVAVASSGAVKLTGGDAAAGKAVFSQRCSACHAIAPFAQKVVGPGLKGVLHDPAHPNLVNGNKATPENVAKILQNGYNGPMGTMPNQTANQLSDKDIANLVSFLDSLK
ncbi:MAG: cytochrome c oxidase subunit II [Candidatus Baltobacteraceae bacterium]